MPAAVRSSPPVVVLLGPARSGKTHELVERYARVLAEKSPARLAGRTGARSGSRGLLWLAPSSRAAAAVRDELIDCGVEACLAPGVQTFDGLAQQIISNAKQKVRLISPVAERDLLRRVVAAALAEKKLKFYADAAGRGGFVDLVAEHIRELQRHDIRPDAYTRIAAASRGREQHVELAHLYTDYESLRLAHNLLDTEGCYVAARDLVARRASSVAGVCDPGHVASSVAGVYDPGGIGERPASQRPATGGDASHRTFDLIVVDGFTDFTHVQLDLLALLARGTDQLIISLPMDSVVGVCDPDGVGEKPASQRPATACQPASAATAMRADLFAKTTATLAQLRERFPQLVIERTGPRTGNVPALDHLTHNVFRHPQPAPSAEVLASLDRVEIVAAASAQDEIVQLARRIKGRLTQGDKPGDILVVFRSLADPQRIEDVFDRYGIPYSLEAAPRIARAPAFNTLTALLELEVDNWPFRRLVSVITNTSLRALADDSRQAADWLVRDLQLVKGRGKLLDVVTGLAAQQESAEQFSDRHRRRIAAAVASRSALSQLAAAFDRLPKEATTSEWAAALAALATELGLALDDPMNAAAWTAIETHFATLERLNSWLGEPPRQLDLRGVLTLLIDVATTEALPRSFDEAGRVRILAAKTARGIAARHVYLAGMSEQGFPAPARSGVLAGEAEYGFFVRAAKQKEGTGDRGQGTGIEGVTHSQEEMLLFYEVLSRAEESLTISYAAMDDKAQELPPSPYVVELQRMFRHCDQGIAIAKPQLSPISTPAEPRRANHESTSQGRSARGPYSIADWRLQAVAEAIAPDRDARQFAGLFSHAETKPLAASIDAGIRIIHSRARANEFSAAEGLLRSPGVLVKLTERFGTKYSWSPSQLETYAACPFKFYLENVLKLEPLGDLVLETDFARRGSLFHEVLAAFHRKYRDAPEAEWAALWASEERFKEELRNVLAATFGVTREGIDGALVELDRRQINKWADQFRDQQAKYDKPWSTFDEPPRPKHFELRFGKKHASESGHEDEGSTNVAFSLDIGGETIQISGRIDRIDVGNTGGQTVFNVIDYKSGKRPTLSHDKIESGERLQPAVYAMAAEALLFGGGGAVPLWAGYWSMQQGVNTQEKFSLHCSNAEGKLTEAWEALRPKVIERIAQIVRGARKGDFPVASTDLQCTRTCDFRTVCRVAQVRSLEKVWPNEDKTKA